ncbi:MAG: hypothetical protein JNM91_06255, partial [Flavobacteriales bacterium]|nr:hypothetical protein [Flavobacteriales bacterium]
NGVGDIGILPIELVRFTGEKAGPSNLLTWTTASESNSDRFEVMRGEDTDVFRSIGFVQAAGESQAMLDYSYLDRSPPNGTAYYQLRMVDRDGTEELSEMVAIARGNSPLVLFPNPADNSVDVLLGEHTGTSLQLIGQDGRSVMSFPIATDAVRARINLDGVAAGGYSLLLRDAQGAVLNAAPLIKR